jgi:hypothetical protein
LRDKAIVSRKQVKIGDIATLTGGSEVARQVIQDLDIDELPPAGKTRSCPQSQVVFRLRLAGLSPDQFQVTGAATTMIIPDRRAIPAVQVEEASRRAIARMLPDPKGFEIRLVRPIVAALPQLAEDETPTFEAEPQQSLRGPGRVQVNVTIRVDGEHRFALPTYFEVRQSDPSNSLDLTPVIRPGDVVRMSVTSGNLKITGTGEALQFGRIGDRIRVRNVDSKNVITGRVDGPKSVVIEMPGP